MVREKEGWGAEGVSPKYKSELLRFTTRIIRQQQRAHPEFQLENANFYAEVRLTTGQSNLTKSASWGLIPRLGVTPGGRKLYH